MKKIIIIVLIFIMSGCSKQEPPQEPTYFLFASPLTNHPLWLQAKSGMEAACKDFKIQCDWKGPARISISAMQDAIYTGLMKQADGIITQGVIHPSLIESGTKKGIPFVLVDSPLQGANPLATITKDFDEQAELLLNDIEHKMGATTFLKIGFQVSDLSFDLAQKQMDAIRKVFKTHEGGFEVVSISESKSDIIRSKNEWAKIFREQTDMNLAINLAGENAIGCVEAKEYTKNQADIQIYGVDNMYDTIALIKKGKIAGSVVTSFYDYGYESIKILYEKVKEHKEPTKKLIPAKLVLVDKSNIDTYEKEFK
ncbi:MAG: substrate-binding domain-containing protein [Longicatena sp.]